MTFVLEIKIQKDILKQIITTILAVDLSFLKPCYDGNIHTYGTTQNLKRTEYTLKSKNMKAATGIQFTLIQKLTCPSMFFIKMLPFSYPLLCPF